MKTLSAYQVKNRIEVNPDVKLVMTLGPDSYAKCHIPNSLNIWNIEAAKVVLPHDCEIIVYCSDQSCLASYYAYQQLERNGYRNIWRFAGGLLEWSKANLPLIENSKQHKINIHHKNQIL